MSESGCSNSILFNNQVECTGNDLCTQVELKDTEYVSVYTMMPNGGWGNQDVSSLIPCG